MNINNKSFEFSFGLDQYAKFLGDFYQWDVNNYSELTDLANEVHSKNWTPEEYASAYQDEVDLVNALQSGDINSFDAASLGAALGADLQDAAEVIAAASSAGVSVDLEAAAQGAGFDSFASAVATAARALSLHERGPPVQRGVRLRPRGCESDHQGGARTAHLRYLCRMRRSQPSLHHAVRPLTQSCLTRLTSIPRSRSGRRM